MTSKTDQCNNKKYWVLLAILSASCVMVYMMTGQYIYVHTIIRMHPVGGHTQQTVGHNYTTNLSSSAAKGDTSGVKLVILLAYQRVGSSFIGSIFDQNPDMLYIYEPLDAVYTRLYGTKTGWAVPMDIHFHWNRTYRDISNYEKETLSQLMEQLFTCDYENMMTESMVSEFWNKFTQTQVSPYGKCLEQVHAGVDHCRRKLLPLCPNRVGKDPEKQDYCERQLAALYSNNIINNSRLLPERIFTNYKTCMDSQKQVVEKKCLPIIKGICNAKRVRFIKTVRLGADSIDTLMAKYENLRVIHLFRDPRPVSISRVKEFWASHGSVNLMECNKNIHKALGGTVSKAYHGQITKPLNQSREQDLAWMSALHNRPLTEIGKIAQMYCYQVMRDLTLLRGYEDKYPGRTYQMVFENVASDPVGETEKVYQFIDEPVPSSVIGWLKGHTEGKVNSKMIAEKWQSEINHATAKDMEKQCEYLFREISVFKPL